MFYFDIFNEIVSYQGFDDSLNFSLTCQKYYELLKDSKINYTKFLTINQYKKLKEKYSGLNSKCIKIQDNRKDLSNEDLKDLVGIHILLLSRDKNITDKGLECLGDVHMIYLSSNNLITDEGLKYIPNVRYLNLNNNMNITDEGLKYIPNVKYLDLECNKIITYNGLKKHMLNFEYYETLKNLNHITLSDILFNMSNIRIEELNYLSLCNILSEMTAIKIENLKPLDDLFYDDLYYDKELYAFFIPYNLGFINQKLKLC